ncbi:ATP-dependent DNA ligase LigD phosphoesterase module/ATP-dependent DNA ligase LigD polymerase module [Chitinophaga terrae (ex Kim and Jung 2007)]|uniref:DNA ligase (ATP) n=1 Tax=Chitinophaga terrae (ex Kim and Jung 2007) TaxID=408074 RepID=A0A1H3XRS4_9BACT|nr:DNA ligase D [Chitinophaga terrae (ex Kim and Jung 2007)]GEP89355.1 ATP-dependent DNA ligase [Chitinophaga terrae (ex Kim and Jung 2007)]SEA02165.1 ATP-dependent DNA ligase LigD phosphoesterase module/ATP-dependent DNA ligase LigD polymerase module [Chitinophaga terrae (ex Kim and Jung 2007)]
MSLAKYRQKRDFKETTEPQAGKPEKGKHIFVVQRHHASRLHYDFRLEVDGVLKSWAVPKGPSMNPADKRLAMEVEDHPYDYKDFEGTIPAGNYGAGTVYIWDKGTFELLRGDGDFDKEALKEIKDGDLKIVMKGKKLKGEFALVKMKGGREANAWLLIKHKDKYAVDEYDSEDYTPERVKAQGLKNKAASKAAKKKVVNLPPENSSKRAMKKLYQPMLATLVNQPFDGEDWLFETKWDGYRAIAAVKKQKVELYSRNQKSFNDDYPDIVAALEQLDHDVVLDGEIIVLGKDKRSDFQQLQQYRTSGKGQLVYMIFDLLHLDGNELQHLTLLERKSLLKDLLSNIRDKRLKYSDHVLENGIRFYDKAREKQWEGIMAKKTDSVYEEGKRVKSWLKVKIVNEQEALICGYTAPRGSRKKIGALILGMYEGKKLRYIGHCGGGLNTDSLGTLYDKLQPLVTNNAPFAEKIATNTPVTWVKPQLVCEVKFQEWTSDGHLRQPVFLGLREDKPAKDVHPEKPKALDMATIEKERTLTLNGKKVALTNQTKLYWPDEQITKGQLVDYYMSVARFILPHLKDRPLSLHRFPNGINGPSFYQKDLDLEQAPDWIKSYTMVAESTGKEVDYMVCNNEASLAYMINLGCIEVNPWLSRLSKLDNPDFIVLDLDPEKIDFKYVVETAQKVKEILDGYKIDSFCKTSGSRGLHIYIPTNGKFEYETTRLFAEFVAKQVNEALPKTTSVIRAKASRQKKVYIDFLQNSRGQTVAAPYSVRPKPGATVSMPLLWGEVNERLKMSDFNIFNSLERINEKGDLWHDIKSHKNDLRNAIRSIEKQAVT